MDNKPKQTQQDIYLQALIDSAVKATTPAEVAQIRQKALKHAAQAIDATSAYVMHYNHEKNQSTLVQEYFSPYVAIRELDSTIGEVYSEDDYPATRTWLQAARPEPRQVHKDDLDTTSREYREFQTLGALSALYIPVYSQGKLWGYMEFWETRRKRVFNEEEIHGLQDIARGVGFAVDREKHLQGDGSA